MFESIEQIAVQEDETGEDELRRVGWAELAAAISLSRSLRNAEKGLLAQAGPSFDSSDSKDERGINLSYLASRKAPGVTEGLIADPAPRRHRENR